MSWVLVATAGAGALKGGLDAGRQQSIGEADNIARAETIRLSPWTGLGDPGAADYGQGVLSGAVGGGIQGALVGNSLAGAIPAAPTGANVVQGQGQTLGLNALQQPGSPDGLQMLVDPRYQQQKQSPWGIQSDIVVG